MRKARFITALLFATTALAQAAPPSTAKDENGMRIYQVGFLSRGPAWTPAVTDETRSIQAKHLEHIGAMARTGKLILAGPFLYDSEDTDQNLRGIFVFDVATKAEAQAMAAEDPAVKAGRLKIDVLTWYGPYGLTYEDHRKILDAEPGPKQP